MGSNFPALMIEVELLNVRNGWKGMINALEHIHNKWEDYQGTAVGWQYNLFTLEMSKHLSSFVLTR